MSLSIRMHRGRSIGAVALALAALASGGCIHPPNRMVTERRVDGIMVQRAPHIGCRDINGDGYGDGITLGVTMFSEVTKQPCVGDGTLTVRLLQFDEGGGSHEAKSWEFTPEQIRAGVRNVSLGPMFEVVLLWTDLKLTGKGELLVEFHPRGGGRTVRQRQPLSIDFRAIGSHW